MALSQQRPMLNTIEVQDYPKRQTATKPYTRPCPGFQCQRFWYGMVSVMTCVVFFYFVEMERLKRFGLRVDPARVGIYPEMAYIFYGENMGYAYGQWHNAVILILWFLHFLKRTAYVFLSVSYENDRKDDYYLIPKCRYIIISACYYSLFSAWIGYSCMYGRYQHLHLAPHYYFIIAGITLYTAGEVIEIILHRGIAKQGRHLKEKNKLYVASKRLKVYCITQILIWFGFTLVSFTWASCIFAFSQTIKTLIFAILLSRTDNQVLHFPNLFI